MRASSMKETLLDRVDHLVVAAPDLEAAVADFERRLGVRATPGGRHPGRGTHNALIALGPRTYLELIGPDPRQPLPDTPRWFGIDDLETPRLVTWAANGTRLEELASAAERHGVRLGAVSAGSRQRADGALLHWRFTHPAAMPVDGIVPFFIDWGESPHPAGTAAPGSTLVDLKAEHPDAAEARRALTALGLDLAVRPGPRPALIAIVECRGQRMEVR